MKRRKFVVGLGSLAAGASAVMGTGAVTSQTASRDLTVSTASDNSGAYVGLVQLSSHNSQAFANPSGQELVLDVSNNGNGGTGINVDGHSRFDDLFGIVNQGTQDVWAFIRLIGNGAKTHTYFYDSQNPTKALSPNYGNPGPYTDQGESDPLLPDPSNIEYSARRLSVGEALNVGLDIEERSQAAFGQTETIQVVATADPSSVSNFPSNAHN